MRSFLFTQVGCLAVVLAATICCVAPSWADKPGGKGGPGNGGKGKNKISYEAVALDYSAGSAVDINQTGGVVGGIDGVDGSLPYYWQVIDGTPVTIVPWPLSLGISGESGWANSINDNGMIGGFISNQQGDPPQAAIWPAVDAEPILLTAPLVWSSVASVNNQGLVVGYEAGIAVAWHVDVAGSVVGPVALGEGAVPDINDSNLVVGRGALPGGQASYWQLDWEGSSLTARGPWPVINSAGFQWSAATAVNQTGSMIGVFQIEGEWQEAFHVDASLNPRTLVPLVDNRKQYTNNRYAIDINNASPPQVLGKAIVLDRKYGGQQGGGHVIWQETSVLLVADLLDASFPEPQNLNAINDAGWIVGQGYANDETYVNVPIVLMNR